MPDILFIDDDAEDNFIMQNAFESAGLHGSAFFATGADEAMVLLNASVEVLPSLIVLDLNMPKVNGTQILQMLKESEAFCDIPVIVCSTSVNRIEREQCLALGAHSFIVKPLTFDEAVKTAIEFNKLAQAFNH
ncbi:response regulator [Deminuibacter soli]|uniref:Response regulator n=1 Tax=Deminuibacter soli TaxID=2291815 RepID=A0A3E1NFY6_9BACT|nr:response regulator [Deminuibacter soli]RFM26875.1 response regulator [Deminuibacter soli]